MSSGDFCTALYFMDGKEVPTGIEAPAGPCQVNGKTASGIEMETALDDFNGVIIGAEAYNETPS